MLRGNNARTIRTDLLLRLQDDRWKYCSQCWVLHRYSVWRALQSNWKICMKPCASICDLAGTRSLKCSSLYAGEVDTCPCNAMTFHQRQHLADIGRNPSKAMVPGFNYGGCSYRTTNDLSKPCATITHTCSFNSHPLAEAQIFSRITTGPGSRNMHLYNRFRFDIYRPNSSYSTHRVAIASVLGNGSRIFFMKLVRNFSLE